MVPKLYACEELKTHLVLKAREVAPDISAAAQFELAQEFKTLAENNRSNLFRHENKRHGTSLAGCKNVEKLRQSLANAAIDEAFLNTGGADGIICRYLLKHLQNHLGLQPKATHEGLVYSRMQYWRKLFAGALTNAWDPPIRQLFDGAPLPNVIPPTPAQAAFQPLPVHEVVPELGPDLIDCARLFCLFLFVSK